jgi:hypothetical protein
MNYKDGDLVRYKDTDDTGIVIKQYHPCANIYIVALPSGIQTIHGSHLKPLETK